MSTLGILVALIMIAAPVDAGPLYKTLGTDQAGDGPAPVLDLTALKVRAVRATLEIRLEFVDLTEISVEGTSAGWYFTNQLSRKYLCCQVEVAFGAQPSYRFSHGWQECRRCAKEMVVRGSYNVAEDAVSFFVPVDAVPFVPSDLISGCGRDDVLPSYRCGAVDDFSAYASVPGYGSETLVTTRSYRMRGP